MNPLRLVPRRMLPRNAWGDREFCRRRFVRRQGRRPEPHGPKRLTDHLYRIKTDGSLLDPLCRTVTDKELAKQYIEGLVGPGYAPETYRVLRNAGDISAFIPDRVPCVLKPTHLSGPVMFLTDPDEPLDRETLAGWLCKERYRSTREGNYRGLQPKVIVEEFLSRDDVSVPKGLQAVLLSRRSENDPGRLGTVLPAHAQSLRYELAAASCNLALSRKSRGGQQARTSGRDAGGRGAAILPVFLCPGRFVCALNRRQGRRVNVLPRRRQRSPASSRRRYRTRKAVRPGLPAGCEGLRRGVGRGLTRACPGLCV